MGRLRDSVYYNYKKTWQRAYNIIYKYVVSYRYLLPTIMVQRLIVVYTYYTKRASDLNALAVASSCRLDVLNRCIQNYYRCNNIVGYSIISCNIIILLYRIVYIRRTIGIKIPGGDVTLSRELTSDVYTQRGLRVIQIWLVWHIYKC